MSIWMIDYPPNSGRDQLGVCGRWHVQDAAVQDATEDEPTTAGAASVEAERELLQVGLQVGRSDRALMRAQDPALQKGGDAVHAGHRHVRGTARRGKHSALVHVPVLEQAVVARPAVRAHRRSAGDDVTPKGSRLSPEASGTWRMRTRPKPLGCLTSTAITTMALLLPRPHLPPRTTPPTRVSSTSTAPESRSRSLRTIATR